MKFEKAPFPWFGGKARVAEQAWQAMGKVGHYVEPFFGSGGVLLNRPHLPHTETVNDKDGYVANFWRAVQADPDAVAYYADNPVNENDLHARHSWLIRQADLLVARLEGDPAYYDPIVAGYWVWGISCWIGGGFCSGKGPWHSVDGMLVKMPGNSGQGVYRQRPHLSDGGQGVYRRRPQVGSKRGIDRQSLDGATDLAGYMTRLAGRLRHVRVACGDWTRILGDAVIQLNPPVGIFLDPPYDPDGRDPNIYRVETSISSAVAAWATEHGDDPSLRIVLCGYEGDYEMPSTWRVESWQANGGMGNFNRNGYTNKTKERIWYSPHCLEPADTLDLFSMLLTEEGA